jgi:hypothetical protein
LNKTQLNNPNHVRDRILQTEMLDEERLGPR